MNKALLPFSILAVCAQSAHAVLDISSASTAANGWVEVSFGVGQQSDYFGDAQTANAGTESDIVGDATSPGFFMYSDGTDIAFRMRVGEAANTSEFGSVFVVGFDVNGDNALDFYTALDIDSIGPGNTKADIGVFQFQGAATTPGTTSFAHPKNDVLNGTGNQITSVNYNWSAANTIDDGINGNPLAPVDIDGNGGLDYFISYALPLSEMVAAINNNGFPSFDSSSVVRLVVMNSQNLQQLNNDYAGVNNDLIDDNTPWIDGGLSDPLQVPEHSTYALIFGALALAFTASRRRK